MSRPPIAIGLIIALTRQGGEFFLQRFSGAVGQYALIATLLSAALPRCIEILGQSAVLKDVWGIPVRQEGLRRS